MVFCDDEFFSFLKSLKDEDIENMSDELYTKFLNVMGGPDGIKQAEKQCREWANKLDKEK